MLPGLLIGGCSGDDSIDATSDTRADLVARGKYFVEALGGCTECHTPRDATGQPRAGKSGLVHRMSKRRTREAMPPIASEETDVAGIDLVTRWIAGL